MHAAADACCNSCQLLVSKLCLFSGAEAACQFVLDISACMTASNMLVQNYVVMTFYSVHSCSPVTYYAADKLPASINNSLRLPNIHQLCPVNTVRHSIFFLFWFSEWYGTISHTVVCIQERGHMHICLFLFWFLSSTTGPVS